MVNQTHKKRPRRGMKDLFNAYMLKGAVYDPETDMPICACTLNTIPEHLALYDEIKNVPESEKATTLVVFYRYESKFDGRRKGIWFDGRQSVKRLKGFLGAATPDFPTNYDFPNPWIVFNTFRMRTNGHWFNLNGIPTVNNIRWGYKNTWSYSFSGVPKNSMVIISTHGCLRSKKDKQELLDYLGGLK